METDTAKSIHTQGASLIDYNRAATPLIEIVTKPEFHSGEQVAAFLKELQRIARYNDISDADMEKGQMRVDVNISISPVIARPEGSPPGGRNEAIHNEVDRHGSLAMTPQLGTRNEIKNMNSISAIMRAIDHEYHRQITVLESGGKIAQATRRWDDIAGESFVMRSKEDALDYRYFPEPDLPPLTITREILDEVDTTPLLLPSVFITRCRQEFEFHKEYINALINDKETLDYFLACLDDGCDPKETVKWIAWPMLAYTKEHFLTLSELKFDRGQFVTFLRMIEYHKNNTPETKSIKVEWESTARITNFSETINRMRKFWNNDFKIIMEEMLATWKNPEITIKDLDLNQTQWNDDEIITVIQTILANNPTIVEQYKWWKETAIGFFVGQVMKALAGKIDPNKAKSLLEGELRK